MAGAPPGQQGYENGSRTMPPPLSIPQPGDQSMTSPTSGSARRAAPEPNKRALYVGGLDPRVTEDVLKQIFETTGHVQSVKIIPDKNVSKPNLHVIVLLASTTTHCSLPLSRGRACNAMSFAPWHPFMFSARQRTFCILHVCKQIDF